MILHRTRTRTSRGHRQLRNIRRLFSSSLSGVGKTAFVSLLALLVVANLGLYGFISSRSAAAATTVTLNLGSTSVKDGGTTTANWNTSAQTITLPQSSSISFSGTISSDLNPSTTVPDTNVMGMSFVSSSTGYVAGSAGTVWKTANSGYSWTALTSPEAAVDIEDIDCTDATTCWVVNDSGHIWKTANSGTSWTQQTSGVVVPLFDIVMINATNGWAVGGNPSEVILRTTDGSTWVSTPANTGYGIWQITATSSMDAVIQTNPNTGSTGTLHVTHNGGTTWRNAPMAGTTACGTAGHTLFSSSATSSVFVGDTAGDCASARTLRSGDGGANFHAMTTGLTGGVAALGASSDGSKIVACAGGDCAYSSNGGGTWAPSTVSGVIDGARIVKFVSATSLYISGAAPGNFAYSLDGGANIIVSGSIGIGSWPSASNIKAVVPSKTASSTNVLGFDATPEYRRTTNDFTSVTTPTGLGAVSVRDAECTDTNCVAATSGGTYYSTNGGSSWTQAAINGVGAFSAATNAVTMVGTATAYAVIEGSTTGAIYRSTDGGATWDSVQTLASSSFVSVDCASATTCWAVSRTGDVATIAGKDGDFHIAGGGGGGGTTGVYGTTNGTDWTLQVNLGTPSFTPSQVAAISSTKAITVGVSGGSGEDSYVTADGSTWTSFNVGAAFGSFATVECNTLGTCFAGGGDGSNGTLYYSNDSGATWTAQASGLGTADIHDIEFGDDYRAYLSSSLRAIKKLSLAAPASPPYQSSATVRTTTLDATANNITSATLTITSSTPAGTAITSLLSNDGGTTWTTSTPGTVLTFPTAGSDLRYRANLTTSDTSVTPTISAVSIAFDEIVVTQNLTAGGEQLSPTDAFQHIHPFVIGDGGTGVMAFWDDNRNGSVSNIYGQRVTSLGVAEWASGGVRIASTSSYQHGVLAVPDGSGNALVFWRESATDVEPQQRIVGMKINGSGAAVWGPTTFLSNAAPTYCLNDGIADGAGGAIISYTDSPGSNNFVKRITSAGAVSWTTQAFTGTGSCFGSLGTVVRRVPTGRLALDSTNGKVFDTLAPGFLTGAATRKAYVQRLNLTTGANEYSAAGVEVESMTSASAISTGVQTLGIVPNGSGGFVVAVAGVADTNGDAGAESYMRVVYGTPGPTMATTTLVSQNGTNIHTNIDTGDAEGDASGNLYLAYHAFNATSGRTVLLNKVAPTGTNLWGTSLTGPSGALGTAVLVADSVGMFPKPRIAPDTAGGAYLSWLQQSATPASTDVRGQHMSGGGVPQWTAAQEIVGTGANDGTGNEYKHQPIALSPTSVWFLWDENNVFAQSVNTTNTSSASGGTTSGTTEGGSTVPLNPDAGVPETRTSSIIRWKFTDRSNFETGFQLREEAPGMTARIIFTTEPVATTDLSYIDETGLAPNTRYCNRVVRTLNDKGLSAPTALPCTWTFADPPKDAMVVAPTATTRTVTWAQGNNPVSTTYAIFEKGSGQWVGPNGVLQKDAFWQTRDAWGGDAGATVTGLNAATTYTFQVIAKNGAGKETSPVTAGIGVPANETVNGLPEFEVKKSVAINAFGAAVAAIGMAASAASAAGLALFALSVMAFAVLHRRAGPARCFAGVCRLAASPERSYASVVPRGAGPSFAVHSGVHRAGQATVVVAVLALLVQVIAAGVLALAPGAAFGAESFTGDGKAVATGDALTYQIRVRNTGTGTATSLTLKDALPIGLAYVPGTLTVNGIKQSDPCDNDSVCFSSANKTVSLAYPQIAAGDAVVLTFTTKVTIAPASGSQLALVKNQACTSAKQLPTPTCSNETTNLVAAKTAVNQNINQNANAPVNANAPPAANANTPAVQPVNGNANAPQPTNVNGNANVPVNANLPVTPQPKETQITVNGAAPSVEHPVNDATPEIAGTSAPGSLVLLSVDGRVIGVAYTGENGRFSFTVDEPLADGVHAVSISLKGQEIDRAEFAVDTASPAAVSNLDIQITRIALSIRAALQPGEQRGQDATIVVRGHTSPDTALVRIRVQSDPIEVSFAPPAQDWTREITGRFDPGVHTVTAIAYDAAGNASASATKTFVIPEPGMLASPLALLDDPQVEAAAAIIAPAIVVFAAANVVLATGIPLLLNFLGLLFTQPALLFARREKKGYGTIFNSLSKMPLDLAIIRVRDAGTNRVMQTKVTDHLGRYVFFLRPGAFTLEVTKQGFVHPTKYLAGKTEDIAYTDLLAGAAMSASEPLRLAKNIPADPLEETKTPAAIRRTALLRKLQYAFALIGPIVSLVTLLIIPTVLVLGLALAQFAMFFLFRRLAYKKPPKSHGIIRDAATGKPMPNAIVRIFETTYNKLLETQVTDSRGRYAFLVGQNRYYVTVAKEGYGTVTTPPMDFSAAEKGAVVAKDVKLRAGASAPPRSPAPPATPPSMPRPPLVPAQRPPMPPAPSVQQPASRPVTPPTASPPRPPMPPQKPINGQQKSNNPLKP